MSVLPRMPVRLRAPMLRRMAILAFMLLGVSGRAGAQKYDTLTDRPDPRDFVSRADSRLTLLGNPIRFAGADLPWLGLRPGDKPGAPVHVPTQYEVGDALATVQELAGTVVRARSLAGSAGCAECIEPSAGHFNDAAFAQLDLVLKLAHDMGIKLILPLLGGGGDCGTPAAYDGGVCTYVHWRGAANAAAFFTDPQLRADFLTHVTTVLEHVNALTGVAYADEPAIIAWENCEACAAGLDPATVTEWVELVGHAVHEHDRHHLYENGAFAGRIGKRAQAAVPLAALATPAVDIVGDRMMPSRGDAVLTPRDIAEAGAEVVAAQRAYVVDAFGWSPADWKTEPDFDALIDALAARRDMTGALVSGLQGHADQGGYLPALPPSPGVPEEPALYFPGTESGGMSERIVEARARDIRHLGFEMADIRPTPGFSQPSPPEIISVVGGKVTWRGSAGAKTYSIERSTDPLAIGSWKLVCDQCVTDRSGGWQDPEVPKVPTQYRVSPANANRHVAAPSLAVQNR